MTEELATLRELLERLERAVGLLEGLGGAPAGPAPRGRRAAADVRAESRAREAEQRETRKRATAWLERALPDLVEDGWAVTAVLDLNAAGERVTREAVIERRRVALERLEASNTPRRPVPAEEPTDP